ncbi:hypothetical protein C0995_002049 [Termitomyces sp. Mi166|nr:hypothetical protein C0995_002049 [Termitomyces sp. Mi166\
MTSPTSVRKKPVPYLDIPISRPGSISISVGTALNPIEKATDPFADPEPNTASEPLKNPFDDPQGTRMALDVPKLVVHPATPVEKRLSDTSVNSFTSTGAPKEYGYAI